MTPCPLLLPLRFWRRHFQRHRSRALSPPLPTPQPATMHRTGASMSTEDKKAYLAARHLLSERGIYSKTKRQVRSAG